MFSLTEQKCPAPLTATSQSYSQSAATEHHLLASSDTSCTPWRATSRTSTTTIPLSRTSCWQDAHISSTCCQCCWFFLVANGQSKNQSKPVVLDSNTTSNTAWTALHHGREKVARECSMPHWRAASYWEIWCPSRQIAKRTSHGNMKTTKLLNHIETKKVFNLGADTSTVEWLSPSRGGALASATCDHVWKGPRPSDRRRSSRAWTLRASWWATPGSCPVAWWTRSPTIRLGPPRLQSGDELGEEKQRRPCTKHAGWCWRARGVASERGFSCNKIKTTINHDGPDFEQQAWSDVDHVETHDAKSGLTIMRRMVKPKTDPRCTRVPSLRKSCHKPQSLCLSRCPLRKCFFHKTAQRWNSELWNWSRRKTEIMWLSASCSTKMCHGPAMSNSTLSGLLRFTSGPVLTTVHCFLY